MNMSDIAKAKAKAMAAKETATSTTEINTNTNTNISTSTSTNTNTNLISSSSSLHENGHGHGDGDGDGDDAKSKSTFSHGTSTFVYVCTLSDITIGSAKCFYLYQRHIVIYRTKKPTSSVSNSVIAPDGSRLWALDGICYHMGGPMQQADIEDIGGRLVAVCPWHRYKITLDSGEGLYQPSRGIWQSKGKRQRTHPLRISGNDIMIHIMNASQTGSTLASDEYAERDRDMNITSTKPISITFG